MISLCRGLARNTTPSRSWSYRAAAMCLLVSARFATENMHSHHLDGAAGETERHGPHGSLSGPVDHLVQGGQDVFWRKRELEVIPTRLPPVLHLVRFCVETSLRQTPYQCNPRCLIFSCSNVLPVCPKPRTSTEDHLPHSPAPFRGVSKLSWLEPCCATVVTGKLVDGLKSLV
jgi:hypothetical protein